MLTSEHSLWFLPLCLIAGLLYAFILYYKADKPELPIWVKRVSFVMRTLSIFLLCFLLLNPYIMSVRKEKIAPIVLVGIDNSSSILLSKDSVYYKNDFQQQLQKTIKHLQRNFRVETFLLGDTLRHGLEMNFKDKESNLADLFDVAQKKYINQNVGAVVLISDGIFNVGKNPFYIANDLSCPIYTLAMGDTTIRKDLLITKVNHNKTVFKNNFFPLEILIQANKLIHQNSKLTVSEKNEILFEKNISISSNTYSEWVTLSLEAKDAGMHRYKISLTPVDDEITTENNSMDVFIQVIDERKKIALIYNAPHPDISAIVQSLKGNENYKIETFPVDKFNASVNDYDVIILHQLPSRSNQAKQIMESIKKMQMPVFFIFGNQTNYSLVSSLNLGIQLQLSKEMYNDAYPVYNQNFSTFILSNIVHDVFQDFPPVQVPFANYRLATSADVFLSQKIGNIQTTYPLWFYNQIDNQKIVVCLADGIWRWRNYNYMLEENHDAFNELISKSIQYLTVKEDKSFFRVSGEHVYNENEAIIFNAELYNQNYELINDPEVTMQIGNKDKSYTYTFSRTFKSYHLDAGKLPVGDYQWKANVVIGDKKYEKNGYFSVKKVNIEAMNLIADHQLLKNIATINRGAMFYPNQLNELENKIKNNKEIITVARYNKRHNSLLNSILMLIVIVSSLGAEWFLRKWSGSY